MITTTLVASCADVDPSLGLPKASGPGYRSRISLRSHLLGFAAILLLTPGSAMAGFIVSVGSATVTAGQSGYLDIDFTDVAGGPYDLAAYQIEMDLSGGTTSGVDLTQFAQSANAIFPGQTALQTNGRPALPGTIAAANDFLLSGSNPISSNEGLIRVDFSTTASSAGIYNVVIDPATARTNFSDGSGNLMTPAGYTAGTITVNPVPEPATLVLLLAGGAAYLVCQARKRVAR